jgi:ketosteroid isomerase-like protein
MSKFFESNILVLENRLKYAMINSNISELDEMLADDLIFTNHLGQLMTKQEDLNSHKTGQSKIENIEFGDIKIMPFNEMALVNAEVQLVGNFNGESSKNTFRFSRIWSKNSNNVWQVIMAHSTLVA